MAQDGVQHVHPARAEQRTNLRDDSLDVRKTVESLIGYGVGAWKADLKNWWERDLTHSVLKHSVPFHATHIGGRGVCTVPNRPSNPLKSKKVIQKHPEHYKGVFYIGAFYN